MKQTMTHEPTISQITPLQSETAVSSPMVDQLVDQTRSIIAENPEIRDFVDSNTHFMGIVVGGVVRTIS